jgi:uncharacterized phage-associated protein
MYTSKAITNEFIALAAAQGRGDLSPMKLQKLVYLAHGWHLANFDEPLIKEVVQAWRYGPVIPSLYHDLKQYGNEPVTEELHSVKYEDGKFSRFVPRVDDSDEKAKAIIEQVWEVYGKFSPIQLSNLTHEHGTPWKTITSEYPTIPSDLEIPDELIKQCFKHYLEHASND